MASRNLPFIPLPGFPQFLTDQIARVDAILERAALMEPGCAYQFPESSVGACDGGFSCHGRATHGEFCAKHAREVSHG